MKKLYYYILFLFCCLNVSAYGQDGLNEQRGQGSQKNGGAFFVNSESDPQVVVVDLGKVSRSKNIVDIFDTTQSNHHFGLPTNEIFYKLQLTEGMAIALSNHPAANNAGASYETAIYLLDTEENIIQSTQNGVDGLTVENLSPGTYYIVSEGKTQNMSIITEVTTTYLETYPELGNHNYILRRTYTSTEADGSNSRVCIDYFDGFGRLEESVQKHYAPSKSDLVTLQEYDDFGRPSNLWLPAEFSGNNGRHVSSDIIKKIAATQHGDSNPFSHTVYESSPINRVLEQYGPGADWHNNGKSVSTAYKVNIYGDAKLNCKLYNVGGTFQNPILSLNGSYTTGQLYVTRVKDEDGSTSYEFMDKSGLVILNRQMVGNVAHDTYYVYDDFGNKCFVLPPRINDEGITQAMLDKFAYQYKYDTHNHCIAKRVPGCDWVYYIYDKADRLIFSQDGNRRQAGEWMFYIPDISGKECFSGVCRNTFDLFSDPLDSVVVKADWYSGSSYGDGPYQGYYLSGVSLVSPIVLTVNYYNNYSFLGRNGIPSETDERTCYDESAELDGFGKRYIESSQGLLTGTMIAELPNANEPFMTVDYRYNVFYYDNLERVIQTKSSSYWSDEKEYFTYNFEGQPIKKKHFHSPYRGNDQTELYFYTYDNEGRSRLTTYQLNGGENVTLANRHYDVLGRLVLDFRSGRSELHTGYGYNVRSQIKYITSDFFNQTLYYNDSRPGGTNVSCYNGNISGVDWKINTYWDNKQRSYNFTYDELSRLIGADYLESNVLNDKFSTSYSYDKHGNMLSIRRHGNIGTTTYGVVDDLALSYDGNQLVNVEDKGTIPSLSMSMDFKDGSHELVEYSYDANGNQTQDLNKGISKFEYNVLNLPKLITSNGIKKSVIEYTYSATGVKLSTYKDYYSKFTDYMGNMIYENGSLKRILIDGGYIENGIYYFYIQDYLGNNQIVIKEDGALPQANHYYPFGGSFAEGYDVSLQPYRYNGKELYVENGLNLYDYEARQMDATLGRFTSIDPMAEKYYSWSPYAYCLGNPVKFVDPSGMLASPYYTSEGDFLGVDEHGFAGAIYITDGETFEKHSGSNGIANSEAIQSDIHTTPLRNTILTLSAQSRIYTDVLNKAADSQFDMLRLYKGKISIVKKVVSRNGKIVAIGFNDPYGHREKPKYSSTKVGDDIRVTVESGYHQFDLDNVESIQNYLGVHEYYGHGIKNWSQHDTHWKCYEAQMNHPSFKKLPKDQQNEIRERYHLYRNRK